MREFISDYLFCFAFETKFHVAQDGLEIRIAKQGQKRVQ